MRLRYCVGISLLLHVLVMLPFLLTAVSGKKPVVREEPLNLELFDMVSERLAEEKRKAGDPGIPDIPTAPPAPAKPEPVKPEMTPKEVPEPEPVIERLVEIPVEEMPVSVFDSPVVIPIPAFSEITLPTVAADTGGIGGTGISISAPAAGGSGGGGGGSGGSDDVNQRGGGRIGSGGTGEANPLSLYIAKVASRLQSNLVYPERMRREGIEAATTIAFAVTESGQIRRNTLEVRKSSGYREMDDNALRAARESAPFDKPPKEMTLVIAVAFEVERSRR